MSLLSLDHFNGPCWIKVLIYLKKKKILLNPKLLHSSVTFCSLDYCGCLAHVWRTFSQVSGEKNRFEKLMEYFMNDDSNIDFMVSMGVNHIHFQLRKRWQLILNYVFFFTGGLHAVHKHCGPLSGKHELPCASSIWVHPAGSWPVLRGQSSVQHIKAWHTAYTGFYMFCVSMKLRMILLM